MQKKSNAAAVDIDCRKELIRLIHQLSGKHSVWQVFEDFLALSALSISNSVDRTHWEERETQYMETIGRYDKSEIELFPQMLAHLIGELERHAERPVDVLGVIFHELELHSKYKGQFFTPQTICDMMGKVAFDDNGRAIAENGYLTVYEPCCGSGAMILGFAKAMQDCKLAYQRQMVVTATDVDLKCVYMTYLQLSLYGIQAVVIHGNSISLEEWSRWYTPVYILNGWLWRQTCGNLNKRYMEDEAMKRASEPMYAAIRDIEAMTVEKVPAVRDAEPAETFDIKLRESDGGQLQFEF